MRKTKKKKIDLSPKTNKPYIKGDFCHYIGSDMKVYLGEIQRVHDSESIIYTLVDQQSYKFVTVHHDSCFDDEKKAKAYAKKQKQKEK
jgi:hypothetical protein